MAKNVRAIPATVNLFNATPITNNKKEASQNENIIEFVVSQNTAQNSSVGILFGFKDWENFCAIYVSGNKYPSNG